MSENNTLDFGDAAIIIKDAIVRSRYQAAKLINKELLSLYYAVGKYVSDNSRTGYWGKGAIKLLSDDIQRKLPGLRGFSEAAIKKMRLFYEAWQPVFSNRSLTMNDLNADSTTVNRQLSMDDFEMDGVPDVGIDLGLLKHDTNEFNMSGFSFDEFCRVGFTHHSEILAKEKSLHGRLFYINQCSIAFWTVETLKSKLRGELYSKESALPSNFIQTIPQTQDAQRALRAFKDEYCQH